MPIKATWKSLFGALAVLGGSLTAAVQSMHLPSAVSAALVVIGGLIVGFERLADSKDFATVTAAVGLPDAPEKIETAVAKVKAEAEAYVADAKGYVVRATADAKKWRDAYQAAIAPPPPAPVIDDPPAPPAPPAGFTADPTPEVPTP